MVCCSELAEWLAFAKKPVTGGFIYASVVGLSVRIVVFQVDVAIDDIFQIAHGEAKIHFRLIDGMESGTLVVNTVLRTILSEENTGGEECTSIELSLPLSLA
jgi:hypothetical protein